VWVNNKKDKRLFFLLCYYFTSFGDGCLIYDRGERKRRERTGGVRAGWERQGHIRKERRALDTGLYDTTVKVVRRTL
jgi:hypothetical protein